MTSPFRSLRAHLRWLLPLLALATLVGCDAWSHKAARETILREDVRTMRDVLGQYHQDRGRYPRQLDDLVEEGYLRTIPIDPFTESRESWRPVYVGEGTVRVVVDVRPGPRPSPSEAWFRRLRHILG
jgi:hypothetical protein